MRRALLFLLILFFNFKMSLAQTKAYVLHSVWSNSFNPYNPAPFFEEVFSLLKTRLKVKDIERNPLSLKVDATETEDKEIIAEHNKDNVSTSYYIALNADLSLPLINLTRIFKVPTRSSRFVFAVNVYNNKAEKILSDTIVNKGCIAKVIDKDKIKDFYSSYEEFVNDMHCHYAAIRKELEKK